MVAAAVVRLMELGLQHLVMVQVQRLLLMESGLLHLFMVQVQRLLLVESGLLHLVMVQVLWLRRVLWYSTRICAPAIVWLWPLL